MLCYNLMAVLFSYVAANVMKFVHKINKIHPSHDHVDKDDSDESHFQVRVRSV